MKYARCAHCGWVGFESELPQDGIHPCGKDECPSCGLKWGISCCFETLESAENDENT